MVIAGIITPPSFVKEDSQRAGYVAQCYVVLHNKERNLLSVPCHVDLIGKCHIPVSQENMSPSNSVSRRQFLKSRTHAL